MKAPLIHYDLCFETLSNELRIKIIEELQKGPISVMELSKRLGVEQSRLSHSLQSLKECNYVTVNTNGKQRIYTLKDDVLTDKTGNIFKVIETHVEEQCKNHCAKIKN